MREGAFSILGSQPWRHVLAAGSRSQASTCGCTAGRTDDVFEIRRAPASVYSVHDLAQFEVNTTADWQPAQHPQSPMTRSAPTWQISEKQGNASLSY